MVIEVALRGASRNRSTRHHRLSNISRTFHFLKWDDTAPILDHVIDDVLVIFVLLAELESLAVGLLVKGRNVDISLFPVANVVWVLLISLDHLVMQRWHEGRRAGLHHALVCNADGVHEALGDARALGHVLELFEQGDVLLALTDLTAQLVLRQLVHNLAIAQVHMLEPVHLCKGDLVAVLVTEVNPEPKIAAPILFVHEQQRVIVLDQLLALQGLPSPLVLVLA